MARHSIVPIAGTATDVAQEEEPGIYEARVIYKDGLPICAFKSETPVNFAKALPNFPGWYAAPYSMATRKLLLSNGIDCPPLIRNFRMPGPFKPFAHQWRTMGTILEHRRIWVLDDPRTGKTLSSCGAIARLLLTGDISRVLILAPKTILSSTWDATLMKVLPAIKTAVSAGSVPEFREIVGDKSNQIVIANHDKVKHGLQAARAGKFDLIIVDEVNKFRHNTTERARALNVLTSNQKYMVWFLTGTPTSGTPDTLYSLVKVINPGVMRNISENRWRDMTMNPYFVGDIKKWSQKPNAEFMIAKVLQPCTRAVRSECFDVPPVTTHMRTIELTPEQRQALAKIKKDKLVHMPEGMVTAVNAGVLRSKVLQICCGAVYTEDRKPVIIHSAIKKRADACIEEWEETGKKLIVLAPYRHVLEATAEYLAKKTRTQVLTLHGDTKNRGLIEPRFQNDDKYQFLVADPETIQYGITLSAADSTVWLSPPYKNETWRQANDRTFGPLSATKRYMGIVMLYSIEIEKVIYNQRLKEETRQDQELGLISALEKFLG